MNFRFSIISLLILGLLASCGPVTPFPTVEPSTITPSPTLAQTITPLPTIPTFTPTFDVSKIVTVTPAEAAVCPQENSNLTADFPIRLPNCVQTSCTITQVENTILDYLNKGGSMNSVVERLKLDSRYSSDTPFFLYKDVTGDANSDLVFEDFNAPSSLSERVVFLRHKKPKRP